MFIFERFLFGSICQVLEFELNVYFLGKEVKKAKYKLQYMFLVIF